MIGLETPTIPYLKIMLMPSRKEMWVPQSELYQGMYPNYLLMNTSGRFTKPKIDLPLLSDEMLKVIKDGMDATLEAKWGHPTSTKFEFNKGVFRKK